MERVVTSSRAPRNMGQPLEHPIFSVHLSIHFNGKLQFTRTGIFELWFPVKIQDIVFAGDADMNLDEFLEDGWLVLAVEGGEDSYP